MVSPRSEGAGTILSPFLVRISPMNVTAMSTGLPVSCSDSLMMSAYLGDSSENQTGESFRFDSSTDSNQIADCQMRACLGMLGQGSPLALVSRIQPPCLRVK